MSENSAVVHKLRSREIRSDEPIVLRPAKLGKPPATEVAKLPTVNEEEAENNEFSSLVTGKTDTQSQPPTYSDLCQSLEQIPPTDDETFVDFPTDDLVANFQKLRCEDLPAAASRQRLRTLSDKTLAIFSPISASAPLYPVQDLLNMESAREVSISTGASKVNSKTNTKDDPSGDKRVMQRDASFFAEMRDAMREMERDRDVVMPETHTHVVHVADSVLAPKTFSGASTDDPEAWLEYFERYASYRHMTEIEKVKLFAMFLRDGAADWYSTLSDHARGTYCNLRGAFIENYFKSPDLLWKTAGDLFSQTQRPEERVDEFVTRVKKCARRLNITDEMLHYAVLHGLRPSIRIHVLQSGVKDLTETVRAARLAEISNNTDPLTALLLESIKNTTKAAEQQASDIKELSAKLSSLTVAPIVQQPGFACVETDTANAVRRDNFSRQNFDDRQQSSFRGRVVRPSPQQQQRQNFAQNANKGMVQRAFREPRVEPTENSCYRCGLRHAAGNCRAEGQRCRRCNKIGHFGRVCRGQATRP